MNKLPPLLFGSCIEDVNHEIYGGLYSQLLYGESFEEPRKERKNGSAVSSAWDPIITGARGLFMLDSTGAYNGRQAQIIEYDSGTGKIGIANSGLNRWGIAVKKNGAFQGRIYLRGEAGTGPVTVALENADGSKTYAAQTLVNLTEAWKKYPFTLIANTTDRHARFAVYLEKKGILWLDQAVLMPAGEGRFKNLPIRADIADCLQREGINFLRYGGSMVNAAEYRWKNMVGDPDKRPPYKGWWHPYSSNGFAIAEFVQFCGAAGFEPAIAINIEETPADVADMVNHLNGGSDPQKAKIHFIEIGNEEVIAADDPDGYRHYAERFNLLYDAIHARDPDVQVICAAWWRSASPYMQAVFKAINGKASFWDLHTSADAARSGETVDRSLTTMQRLFLEWDPNSRLKCAIFEENGSRHDLQRALGHAGILNAVRRHGDFVLTSCPANALQPFRQNDNGWNQGQIFFTPSLVWGMPPFYAQQMASGNHQPLRIFTSVQGDLDVTATRSLQADALVIHVINPSAAPIKTGITVKGFANAKSGVKSSSLSGAPGARNTPAHPKKIIPIETTVLLTGDRLHCVFPANSYTVLRLEKTFP